MATIVDYGEFAERLKAPANRWDVLREFHEEWGYAVRPDASRWNRWSEDEHKKYVLALGGKTETDGFEGVDLALPIPAALDEWWELPYNSFTHDCRLYWTNPEYPPTVRPDPSGYGVSSAIPDGSDLVAPDADHRVCVFMAEYEYCNEWGYPAAEAHDPDPRVLVSVGGDEEWVLQARSVSEFFLQLAVDRLPRTLGWSTQLYQEDVEDGDPSAMVEKIEAELPALGFEPWREMGQDTIVRGGPDVLVHLAKGEYGGIHFSGRTPKALLDLAGRLGMERTEDELKPPTKPEDC